MTYWHTIEISENTTRDTLNAFIEIGPESQWFSGHFPEEPILPGFALLSMVFDVIQSIYKERIFMSGLKKIRFKQVVRPGDRIEINAEIVNKSQPEHTVSFNVSIKGISVCKGTLIIDFLNKT